MYVDQCSLRAERPQDARKWEACNEQQLTLDWREVSVISSSLYYRQALHTGYMIFLNESFRETVEYRTGLLYVTLALLGVLTLSEEVIPLFCRDPQGRLVVSLNTSGVACWLSFWISMFCYYFGYPFVTSSNCHILWNNWTRAWMSHCTEGSRPVRGIILQRCGMNILNWNTKLPRWWKALIVLSLGDFHWMSSWLGFGLLSASPIPSLEPSPFFHSLFPLTQLTLISPFTD